MSRLKSDPLVAESLREFYTQILHFLRKRTDNASDAADMTQDVFTQWLGYQDRAKVEQPRAFLFQMARNLLRDHWRRQQVRQAVHSEHVESEPEPLSDERYEPMAAAQRLQRLDQLKAVLAELPPRRREALMLHRFEGLSQAQIAQRMGISVSMVEKHIAFALLHCKQHSNFALPTALAVLCAMFSLNLGAPVSLHQQYVATQPQGTQTVLLPDGSTLSVNANTRLRIDFGAYQRDIYLDKGQLYIEVAANKEQPLVVHAGDASIRVVGTGFDVRRSQHQLVVSVAHGQVAFMPDANTSTLLGAQQRTTYDYARASTQEQNLSPGEVADWRSGHLSFRNRELASLVDELDLYRPGMIQLADGPLGRYKVSGNLDVNDPMALVKALPALIPVKTVLLDNGKIRIEPR